MATSPGSATLSPGWFMQGNDVSYIYFTLI
jgi:hypothetical protein